MFHWNRTQLIMKRGDEFQIGISSFGNESTGNYHIITQLRFVPTSELITLLYALSPRRYVSILGSVFSYYVANETLLTDLCAFAKYEAIRNVVVVAYNMYRQKLFRCYMV